MSPRLETLLRHLDGLGQAPSLTELSTVLHRFPLDCDDVASFVRFSPLSYARNLVRAGEHYHAWVLCWNNGQRSPIHDHVGSRCVVRVLRGPLTETRFAFAANGQVKAIESRDFGPGALLASEDADLHQISNLQANDADLVTLHVYAPPLVSMGLYSLFDRSRGQDIWNVEFSDAAGI